MRTRRSRRGAAFSSMGRLADQPSRHTKVSLLRRPAARLRPWSAGKSGRQPVTDPFEVLHGYRSSLPGNRRRSRSGGRRTLRSRTRRTRFLGTGSGRGHRRDRRSLCDLEPELTVAISSSGPRADLRLRWGDALGSNVVNIGLVVGIVLLLGVTSAADISRRDAGDGARDGRATPRPPRRWQRVPNGTAWCCLVPSRSWLVVTTTRGHAGPERDRGGRGRKAPWTLGGRSAPRTRLSRRSGSLPRALEAKEIGADLGISTFVVGAVLVSFGTSLPELATASHLPLSWLR